MSTRQKRPRPVLALYGGRGLRGGYVKQQFIDMLRGQNWCPHEKGSRTHAGSLQLDSSQRLYSLPTGRRIQKTNLHVLGIKPSLDHRSFALNRADMQVRREDGTCEYWRRITLGPVIGLRPLRHRRFKWAGAYTTRGASRFTEHPRNPREGIWAGPS